MTTEGVQATPAGSFTVTPAYRDFRAANRLAARSSWGTPRMRWLHALVIGLALLMIVGEDMGRRGFSWSGLGQSLFASALFIALVYAALFALGRVLIDSRARGAWTMERREGLETRYTFDAARLTIANAQERHALAWTSLAAVLEDRHTLLLLPNRATFHAIPKQQVPADTLAALRSALDAARVPTRL